MLLPIGEFYKGKRVLITGHTGFIGSWLTKWLDMMDADICGCSLDPPTEPNMYELLHLSENIRDVRLDVRDYESLYSAVKDFAPEIVFHLAAQPLVLKSYEDPIATIETNVVGTANLLECVRKVGNTNVIIVMTSDKVYQNEEWVYPYRETDPLGGRDPYSASKSCADIIVNSYRESFFKDSGVGVSTIRAGNVIGGGDWAPHRIVPDIVAGILNNAPIQIRNPDSIRPWQFVLEPLSGIFLLVEKMYSNQAKYSGAWNFGPEQKKLVTVRDLTHRFVKYWGSGEYEFQNNNDCKEANYLQLDISRAMTELGWRPIYDFENAIKNTVDWYKHWHEDKRSISQLTEHQIHSYGDCMRNSDGR